MTPEARLKEAIKAMLEERGAFWSSIPQGSFGKQGDPDMIVCYRGMFIGVEAKATTKLRKMQELRRDQILAAGGRFIAPHTVKEVSDVLDEIDRLK